jgi:hypothetical protein
MNLEVIQNTGLFHSSSLGFLSNSELAFSESHYFGGVNLGLAHILWSELFYVSVKDSNLFLEFRLCGVLFLKFSPLWIFSCSVYN